MKIKQYRFGDASVFNAMKRLKCPICGYQVVRMEIPVGIRLVCTGLDCGLEYNHVKGDKSRGYCPPEQIESMPSPNWRKQKQEKVQPAAMYFSPCKLDKCDQGARTFGLCQTHYSRYYLAAKRLDAKMPSVEKWIDMGAPTYRVLTNQKEFKI